MIVHFPRFNWRLAILLLHHFRSAVESVGYLQLHTSLHLSQLVNTDADTEVEVEAATKAVTKATTMAWQNPI